MWCCRNCVVFTENNCDRSNMHVCCDYDCFVAMETKPHYTLTFDHLLLGAKR